MKITPYDPKKKLIISIFWNEFKYKQFFEKYDSELPELLSKVENLVYNTLQQLEFTLVDKENREV